MIYDAWASSMWTSQVANHYCALMLVRFMRRRKTGFYTSMTTDSLSQKRGNSGVGGLLEFLAGWWSAKLMTSHGVKIFDTLVESVALAKSLGGGAKPHCHRSKLQRINEVGELGRIECPSLAQPRLHGPTTTTLRRIRRRRWWRQFKQVLRIKCRVQ